MTKDGPDPNKPCVFPFIDRGVSHSKCTSGALDLQPWCPTEVDQNGHYIDEKWGNCDNNCEIGKYRESSNNTGFGTQKKLYEDIFTIRGVKPNTFTCLNPTMKAYK